ncbi:MAG: hypothetical protein GF350_11905 [Chitinivibrionales bacterium]|nr:hypothetical protein [Chitinivibrionales bacterium]
MITFSSQESSILFGIGFREFISRELDPIEMITVHLLMSSYTVTDIAQMHGCSRRYMYVIINRIKTKFNRFFDSHLE